MFSESNPLNRRWIYCEIHFNGNEEFCKSLDFSPQTTTAELVQTNTKKDNFYLTVKETSFQKLNCHLQL